MELLGGIRICNVMDAGTISLATLPLSNSSSDADITVNPADKIVDQFVSKASGNNALQRFEEEIKIYENVLNDGDIKAKENLTAYKDLLKKMKKNLEEGRASLKEINEYIEEGGFLSGIARENEISLKRKATWFTLTGVKQEPSNQQSTIIGQSDLEAAQNEGKKSLEKLSPKEIAKLQSDREAAKVIAQQAGMPKVSPNVQNTDNMISQALNEANKSTQEKLSDERSRLQERLKDPKLTQEQRQSDEQRIEKIEKAIELLKKIENDKDFQDKIWSKLSEEQQKSILEDIKDGELTEESTQAINRATAAADETQTINEGFFASSKQGMQKMTGMTHEDYYEKYRVQMNLDKSEFIKTNIELKVYSRDSSYDSSSYSSSSKNDSKNSNLSPEEKVANMILELESRGELNTAAQNVNNKDIAQKLGLKPDHPIVLAIAAGDYDLAQELSVGLNIEASINAIAAATTTDNQDLDPWLAINNSVTPAKESNRSLNLFTEGKQFFNLSFS